MILRSPVLGPRIVPYGESRLPSDVLPNGRQAFRATQLFHHVNPNLPAQFNPHRALDIGNGTTPCHRVDAVLAPISGHGRSWHDNATQLNLGAKTDGLGFMIHAADGSRVNLHHLSGYAVPTGQTVEVSAGQLIGWVGSTGIGNVCHLHIDVWNSAGVKVDPWPLLEQNQEADMYEWVARYRRVNPPYWALLKERAPQRYAPKVTAETFAGIAGKEDWVLVTGLVSGDPWPTDPSLTDWLVYARGTGGSSIGLRVCHTNNEIDRRFIQTDCTEDVKTATLAFENKLRGIRDAAAGAAQAIEAVRKAAE